MTGPQRTRRTLAATLALVSLSGFALAARAQDAPPPANNAAPSVAPTSAPSNDAWAPPPTAQPPAPPPGQPAYPPPGQGYPPGYAPPGYAPGYAAPGYAPGYAPPGYPPGYAPPRYVPTEPTHSGVYLHLHLGGGFTSISGSDGYGGTTKVSGGGPSFAVAVGGAVAPNLALFGNFFFTGATQPHVSNGGYSADSSGNALVGGFGAGVVYYFMPANVYLSGAVAAVDFSAEDSTGKTTYQSDVGLGFEALLGKEFWVSEHWGLGAALEFVGASSMKDKNNANVTWSAGAFNLLFSATCF
jgi:hypothetical protein